MKWEISWNMCNIVSLTLLVNKGVKIGKKVYVWKWDVPLSEWVEISDYVSLNDRIVIYSSNKFKVKIGKYCSVWNGASFIASLWHNYHLLTTYSRFLWVNEFPDTDLWWSIKIWHDVRIWKNAIILKWVTVWIWAVIWAWAVVTKDVPPYAIVGWNPAKIIKYRFDIKTIQQLLQCKWRDRDIEKIKQNYHLESFKNLFEN